jgi:uncharacterized protein
MIDWKREWKVVTLFVTVFLMLYYLPLDADRFHNAIYESLYLTQWYAREHVILCLIPAFFIAGAISVFISQAAVLKYFGAQASKFVSYSIASVSGTILAVCSCTVLPIFAGIYRMGAGLGPAAAFLYSGPAINILAIILTAQILGLELGIARAVCAIVFSVVIGLVMHLLFRNEEADTGGNIHMGKEEINRPFWQTGLYFAVLVGILIFANWGAPADTSGFWHLIFRTKWMITALLSVILGFLLFLWFHLAWWQVGITGVLIAGLMLFFPGHPILTFGIGTVLFSALISRSSGELGDWFSSSWDFAKQIFPLLLYGVLIAGAALGRPGHEGLIPASWIANSVGDNSLGANLFASVAGALMYFATLTEVPILQGLLGNGMHQGPALALLLAGPAISLPNMLVIRNIMGTKKTLVFIGLVIAMATVSGRLFGMLYPGQ